MYSLLRLSHFRLVAVSRGKSDPTCFARRGSAASGARGLFAMFWRRILKVLPVIPAMACSSVCLIEGSSGFNGTCLSPLAFL